MKAKHTTTSSKPHFGLFYCKAEGFLNHRDENKAHELLIWPQTQIFSLTNYKKKFSLYFDCCPRLSEVYPVQQYPIVCLQDERRNRFRVKPRVDSQISHRRQSGVSLADNLREHKTGAAYVSDDLVWISERVERKMWRRGRGALSCNGSNYAEVSDERTSTQRLLPTNVVTAGNVVCWLFFFIDDTHK